MKKQMFAIVAAFGLVLAAGSAQAGLSANGLSANGLSANGLSANSLSANSLTSNSLTSNTPSVGNSYLSGFTVEAVELPDGTVLEW